MWQWLIGLLIVILIVGGVWWWSSPGQKLVVPDLISDVTSWEDKILGTKEDTLKNLREVPRELVDQTKTDLQNSISNSASNINQSLDSVLGIKSLSPSQDVLVSIITPGSSVNLNQLSFDMSKDQNIHLKLSKNTKYQIKFNNIPDGYCLYINNTQYKLGEDDLLELSFSSSGKFPIKMDKCELTIKDLGIFEVE